MSSPIKPIDSETRRTVTVIGAAAMDRLSMLLIHRGNGFVVCLMKWAD